MFTYDQDFLYFWLILWLEQWVVTYYNYNFFSFDEIFLIVNIKICHVQTTRLRFSMSRNYKTDMDKHKLDFFTWHVFLKRGCMNCTMDRKPIFSWAYVKAHYLIYGQEYMYFRILLKVSFEWKYRSYI